ncbi:Beta-galactosidase [Neorhodopirellula pilleata]|uniref:Beta-galactosidase n=2 Tax=Neorhodopirellula pilleata TaxID=2714738 RepID=A0A5C5ZHY9_9BACT|nr:Beta-galactosidase [Neorhodopirellula pilleata]
MRLFLSAAYVLLIASMTHAQEASQSQNTPAVSSIVDQWRYLLKRPTPRWTASDFDDSNWLEGDGGFGTVDTPNSRVGTIWEGQHIWLRKNVELSTVPKQPALWIYHDEDAEVYINGAQVAKLAGYTTQYTSVPLIGEAATAIATGRNVMAVHCEQRTGGQFIDVHLYDAANGVPKLPKPERSKFPFRSELFTQWGADVTAENAWTEYPRPQLRRDQWRNLNGEWDYAITDEVQATPPSTWDGTFLVPFSLESKLGGVQRLLDSSEAIWYHRTFDHDSTDGERQMLNFEAVDYECEVWINGTSVGTHRGGCTPFSFDVTDALKSGSNDLIVRVEDDTEGFQLNGKQSITPRGIWYTQVSGIWQTVWMEAVPMQSIDDLKISTDAKTGSIQVQAITSQRANVRVRIKVGDQVVGTGGSSDGGPIKASISNAKLWSPSSPHLYDIEVTLLDASGKEVDRVESYAGIRDVGKSTDDSGNVHFTLNGNKIFHWGPLDQGWWPDGLLTPPSDEAMLFDIEWLKAAGFNMIRKHIKVEPRRYYYHCDRLGMMVWQDQVSGGTNPPWTRLQPDPQDAAWPLEAHEQFMIEFEAMISTLENHPSIVVWTPFNEAWGQHQTIEVGKWTQQRDPSRSVNIASGGNFWPVGDVVDHHEYPHPGFPFDRGEGGRFDGFIKVVGEFGGHGYPVQGHLWDSNRRNWGYGGLPQNEAEYKDRYATSIRMLTDLQAQGIAAGVYTQTTDVEGEINGLMTYDRKVIKIPAEELAELHKALFNSN